MAMMSRRLVLVLSLLSLWAVSAFSEKQERGAVKYDATSLIINGGRELIFSGSIHYPRCPSEIWPDLIRKAREGGLNTIETYVFWNIHEPVQGQYNFEGNYDLVKFVKLIAENEMYAILRIGPFIQAEWNLGGLPFWLREVPNITFRSYNEPFMYHMKKYSEMIVNMMKRENLFAPQGGPIILAQIENEYDHVQLSYREMGLKYIKWAADMATGLYPDIPWVMCEQKDAPLNIISTCNGRHCADTFAGPNGPNKPTLWTENWTAQYRTFGAPPSQRSAEDIAHAVASFFALNGSMTNYYMYYGGTNYGRTSSTFVTTRYYDEAPLDEFGLQREPKWSHLRDLHKTMRLSKKALLWGTPTIQNINKNVQIITNEKPGTGICAAFLVNNHKKIPATVNFRGKVYFLPRRSVSILPDCKTLVFNTDMVVSQHSSRNFYPSKKASNLKWEMYRENIPKLKDLPIRNKSPLELTIVTKDISDYLWYGTSIKFDRDDLPMRPDILPILQIANRGDAMAVFVNGEYVGFGHGSFIEKGFIFSKPINVKPGHNYIALLSMTVGLPNNGAYMEKRFSGVRAVTIEGLNAGNLDFTYNQWRHQVGVNGERLKLFTEEGLHKVQWSSATGPTTPITWYKTYFEAPEGNNPVAIRMDKMGKGMIWVNGKSIGRYWTSYLSPLGSPSQSEYHIPRAFLKPKDNLLVIFEESGGSVDGIVIQTVNRDTICSYINENFPPNVNFFEKKGEGMKAGVENTKVAQLTCPDGKVIKQVEFAGFGDPWGACGSYTAGKCNSANSKKVVEEHCLGKSSCSIPIERSTFVDPGKGSCPDNLARTLAVQVRCGHNKDNDN